MKNLFSLKNLKRAQNRVFNFNALLNVLLVLLFVVIALHVLKVYFLNYNEDFKPNKKNIKRTKNTGKNASSAVSNNRKKSSRQKVRDQLQQAQQPQAQQPQQSTDKNTQKKINRLSRKIQSLIKTDKQLNEKIDQIDESQPLVGTTESFASWNQ